MPVRDLRSQLKPVQIMNSSIVSSTTTTSAIFDTMDYELGVDFVLMPATWTDGTYTPSITESDDAAMAGATAVTGLQLIGTLAGATISAAQTNNAAVNTNFGIVNTKRYVQITITSSGVTSGARIIIDAICKPQLQPAYDTLGN